MRFLIMVLSTYTISCGSYTIVKPTPYWNEVLAKQYEEFVEDARYYGVEVPPREMVIRADFGNPKQFYEHGEGIDTIGICVIAEQDKIVLGGGRLLPYISAEEWREVIIEHHEEYDLEFKSIVYHEFGHCYFNLPHDDKEWAIMHKYNNYTQLEDWDNSLEYFFGKLYE